MLFTLCRYAQSCAFISVIELPKIPTYCPKSSNPCGYWIFCEYFVFIYSVI